MIKTLVKNRIASVLSGVIGKGRGGKIEKASKAKIIGFAALYLLLLVFFAAFSFTMSISLAGVFVPADASWAYFAIFIIASVSVLFIFSIFETKSELFECKDNDLLLSMPIKPRDIVVSRIFVVLLYNYIIQAIIMIPCIIVYAIYSHDAVGTVGMTLISLFTPLLSTALASGVGYLTALIAKRLKNSSFITVGIAVAFLLAYFFGYSYLMEGFDNLVKAGPEGVTITKENAPLLYFIGSSALIKPLSFLTVISASVVFAAIALFVIARSYINVVTDNRGARRIVYKGELAKQKNIILALSVKELAKFTSSATYMLNAGLGIVFEIIVGILAVVKRSELISFFTDMTAETEISATDLICPLMIAAIFLISSMNMISVSALSLEGKNFWIIKSLPIKDRDVLVAKTIPHIVITSAASLITSALLMIAVSAPVKYWPFFILTPIAANIFSSVMGLVINIRFPKFSYQNEAEVVKQSIATILALFIQMLLGIVVIIGNFVLSLFGMGLAAAFITLLVFAGLAVAFTAILFGPSAKKYSKMEP